MTVSPQELAEILTAIFDGRGITRCKVCNRLLHFGFSTGSWIQHRNQAPVCRYPCDLKKVG